MIRGTAIQDEGGGLEAWVEISVEDVNGVLHPVQVIIDTGFTDWLTLPPDFIERLRLPRADNRRVTLADGSVGRYQGYKGKILWHGRLREATVIALDAQPLLGTKALAGNRLTIDFQDGGEVTIQEAVPSP